MVPHLFGLGAHTNLRWARSVKTYFKGIVTTAHTGRRFINYRQIGQAIAEIR